MKRAVILAVLPLVCSASSPAFVHRAPTAVHQANSPRLGDVSPIAPRPARRNQHRHRRGRQLEASLGGGVAPSSLAGVVASSASFVVSRAPAALAAVVGVLVAASVVNALQGGVRGDLGSTADKILGVPAEEATAEHVSKLGGSVCWGGVARACAPVVVDCKIRVNMCCRGLGLLIMNFQLVTPELRTAATAT